MTSFLEIIGGLALIVFAIIAGAAVWYIWKIRRFVKNVPEGMLSGFDLYETPFWNTLNVQLTKIDLDDDCGFTSDTVRDWKAAGFERGPDMTDVQERLMLTFKHREQPWLAFQLDGDPGHRYLYMFDKNGHFLKVGYCPFVCEEKLNAHSAIALSPNQDIEFLCQQLSQLRDEHTFQGITIDPTQWPKQVEQATAQEIDYWCSEFVLTDGQLHEWMESIEEPSTPEQAEKVKAYYDGLIMETQMDAARRHFIEETQMTLPQWERLRESIVVVVDNLYQGKVIDLLSTQALLTSDLERERDYKRKVHSRQQFAQLNSTLPEHDQYAKIGEVSKPVPADIYSRKTLLS